MQKRFISPYAAPISTTHNTATHKRTGQELTIVNSRNTRPKLLLPQITQGIRRPLPRISPLPPPTIPRNNILNRMRRHLQHVPLPPHNPLLHLPNLPPYRNQRPHKPIQLLHALALRRLNHERVRDGPRHRRPVEAVVLQPLRNVGGFDADGGEGARVEDELVGAAARGVGVEDLVVRL